MAEPLSPLIRPHRGPILPVFERLAPPPPENLVAAEIEARTSSGDVVIELHGRGAWIARGAVNRLRRVYDIESIALTRLQAELVLRPPDLRHLDAALESLALHPRGDSAVRRAILEPFTSTCATCGRPVIVEEYQWEAEATVPARKSYHCDGCGDRSRSQEGRTVPVDADDIRRAQRMSRSASNARERLRGRFPAPEPGHPLPGQLLDLYTPRTLDAFDILAERLELDLRAAPIQAALRLALVHALIPSSRLNRQPGRLQALRITSGTLRATVDRGWRERNPWLLFEEGLRHVRSFVQRLESVPGGSIQARVGSDMTALVDGSSNVVLHDAGAAARRTGPTFSLDRPIMPGRLDPRSRIRLVLTQPPIHWSAENLAFAYLATSMVLGRDAAEDLPLDALFGPATASEWGADVAILRRSLAAARTVLAPDGGVVLILDRSGPAGLAAGVLGGVGAGFRLSNAVLAELGDEIAGTLEFSPIDETAASDGSTSEGPFQLSAVERAVSDVAVGVLQARGEPAHYDRLLGEVLIGLDRLGHLRRLVGTRTFAETEARSESAPEATGLFGEVPASGRGDGPASSQWRDSRVPIRGAAHSATEPAAEGEATTAAVDATDGSTPTDASIPTDDVAAGDDPAPTGEALDGGGTLYDRWANAGSGSDPVKLLLEIVLGELRRPDHPRLQELEPGRWWLRSEEDIEAARLPLSDRLEWAVFSLLSTSGELSEQSFYSRIGRMFRGHDAPDEELVRACLESYRADAGAVPGTLRTADSLQARTEEHGTLVGMLVEYGHRLGLRCWISAREQRRLFKGAPLADLLSEAEQRVYLPLVTPGDADALEGTDCIWYVRGKASFLFEVEWTAMLAEPVLRRGAGIPAADTMVRFLVVPPERTELVRLKLARSPLLRRRMEEDNWHILKSDHLRSLYAREEADLEELGPLLGLDPEIEKQGEQLALFG
ncbi:MAG: hypothetical protein H0X20_02900 [Chloroflexi bacterium]|nr:hypothetical protein [Chloroflexota bacterium]